MSPSQIRWTAAGSLTVPNALSRAVNAMPSFRHCCLAYSCPLKYSLNFFKITKVGEARPSRVLLARGGDGAAGDVGEAGHAEVDGGAQPGEIIELGELVPGGGEADLQALGLAEPAFALGFVDAVNGTCSWTQLVP